MRSFSTFGTLPISGARRTEAIAIVEDASREEQHSAANCELQVIRCTQ
jgi:hypothetical protein